MSEAVKRDMEGRSIGASAAVKGAGKAGPVTQEVTPVTQKVTKSYKKDIVSIRFDEGDYDRIKRIAQDRGTSGAALIRQAVKDLIHAAGGV
jgi:hypothetical protein